MFESLSTRAFAVSTTPPVTVLRISASLSLACISWFASWAARTSAVTRAGTPATTFAGRLPRVGSSTSAAGTMGTLSVCPSWTPSDGGGGATDVSGTDELGATAVVVDSSGRSRGVSVMTVVSDTTVVLGPVVVAWDVDGASATVVVGEGSELDGLGTSCAPA